MPLSRLLRGAVLNVLVLEGSVLTLLNVILSNRMEQPNRDALSEENTKMQHNRRRREPRHVNRKMEPKGAQI